MNESIIIKLWTEFRESKHLENGKIPKPEFFSGVTEILIREQGFYWEQARQEKVIRLLYERFNYYKKQIDICDFLISMTILAKISNHLKRRVIFTIMDVDEDGCLSLGEIFKMIFAVEKNFIRELNYINFQSGNLFNEMAFLNSFRKFRSLTLKRHSIEKMNRRYINEELITFGQFEGILNEEIDFRLLPHNESILDFLETRYVEVEMS